MESVLGLGEPLACIWEPLRRAGKRRDIIEVALVFTLMSLFLHAVLLLWPEYRAQHVMGCALSVATAAGLVRMSRLAIVASVVGWVN